MRINLRFLKRNDPYDLGGISVLGDCLKSCVNLRNLSICQSTSRLADSPELWDALAQMKLSQLCLYTYHEGELDLATLRSGVSRLFKTVDIFHLHMRGAADHRNIRLLIEDEASKANRLRKFHPVKAIYVDATVIDRGWDQFSEAPGRNLCLWRNFIATAKPTVSILG